MDEPIAVIGLGCRFPCDIRARKRCGSSCLRAARRWGRCPRIGGRPLMTAHRGAAALRAPPVGLVFERRRRLRRGVLRDLAEGSARMDPQQRLLLEVAREALEHAGIPADSLRQTQTGVFAGACAGEYAHLAATDLSQVDAWSGTGGALSIIANRVSYFFDLRGPSVTVDTACSSSLVAVHLACQSLRTGESNLALAAGVESAAVTGGHPQLRSGRGDVAVGSL